ncbi:hypothetical protein AAU61_04620 [Desulfocarbo indianensis]|nr:hypothetical protein AAU61_04620 [Desulfocarbo indianensis]
MKALKLGAEGWTSELADRREGSLLKEIARLERVSDRSASALVVDDQQTMRLILSQALRQAGFLNIERAADGEAALKIMRGQGCDLALVDWNMPRMDGLTLLDQVRGDEELDDLVFVMVTAETLDTRVIRAAEEKQDAYLTKPISPEKLARRLDLILERRLNTARAMLAEQRGKSDQALDIYLAASQNRPRALWPLFGLGGLLTRLGRWEEAEICYQRILEQDAEVSAAWLQMGVLRQAQGRVGEALGFYQKALEQSPRYFKAYDALAQTMLAEGDAAGAVGVLDQAMARQGGENAFRQELLGRTQLDLRHYFKAESAFRKALELKPHHNQMEKQLNLGRALAGQERHQEAAEAFGAAAAEARRQGRSEERLQALLLAGSALAQGGDAAAAEDMFAQILEPDAWPQGEAPWDQARFHREIGEAYLASGLDEMALRHFGDCLRGAEGDCGGEAGVAAVCARLGREDLLDRVQEEVSAVRRERAEDCARRGLELVARGLLREALAEYHRGLEIDPEAGRLHFNLGRLRERMGDRREALASMSAAARDGLQKGDWELLVETARFLAGVDKRRQALGLLAKVREQDPDYVPAEELWRRLGGPAAEAAINEEPA